MLPVAVLNQRKTRAYKTPSASRVSAATGKSKAAQVKKARDSVRYREDLQEYSEELAQCRAALVGIQTE